MEEKETSIAKITIRLSPFYDTCLGSIESENIDYQIKVLDQLAFELERAMEQTESFTYGRTVINALCQTLQYTQGNLRYVAQILDGVSVLKTRCETGSVGYRGNPSQI